MMKKIQVFNYPHVVDGKGEFLGPGTGWGRSFDAMLNAIVETM